MKAKTQFLKMYYKLPKKSRELIWYFQNGKHIYNLNFIALEVKANTKLSLEILEDMGFKDK